MKEKLTSNESTLHWMNARTRWILIQTNEWSSTFATNSTHHIANFHWIILPNILARIWTCCSTFIVLFVSTVASIE